MRRALARALVLVGLVAAVAVLTGTAAANPGKSPKFSTITDTVMFVDTNPCTGSPEEVTLDVEIFVNGFPRPNGFHGTALFWIETTTSGGFHEPRTPVGPDVINVNGNNGVVTFTAILNSTLTNDVTGQRFRVHLNLNVTDVRGEPVVEVDHFMIDCLGPA